MGKLPSSLTKYILLGAFRGPQSGILSLAYFSITQMEVKATNILNRDVIWLFDEKSQLGFRALKSLIVRIQVHLTFVGAP